jgi:general secretion pathway protein B
LTSQKTSETSDTQDKVLLTTSESVNEPRAEGEDQAKKTSQRSGQDDTDLAEPQQQDTGLDEFEEGALLTQTPDETSLGGVSADLLARFNRALKDIENDTGQQETETTVSVVSDLPRVDQLRALTLTRLPSMTFSAHMYSSNRDTRWVRVNGRQLYEGEWIEDGLQLVNIEPQRVVLSFQGELFTMAALTDW